MEVKRDEIQITQLHNFQIIAKDPSDMDVILTPPAEVDDGVWKYEHLRQVCLELNGLALLLQVIIIIIIMVVR